MRIGAFTTLRIIIMLRRIWRSLDRLADIESSRLELERSEMNMKYPNWENFGRKPKPAEIGIAQVDDWNKKWELENPEW